ncbi:MAG: hypothetical protein WAO58_03380 [Fimbriimonadaceae bacterium]
MSSLKKFLHSGCVSFATLACLLIGAVSPGQVGKPGLVGKPALSPASAESKLKASASQFLENRGQWESKVRFLARTPAANVWITNKGVVYDFFKIRGEGDSARQVGHAMSMELEGAMLPKMIGRGDTNHRTDFITSTPRGNITGAKNFGEVIAKGVYPGIDVRYYFDKGKPRYDFILRKGADPSKIRFDLKGVGKVRVAPNGDLIIGTTLGDIRHAGLAAYQTVNGKKRSVSVKFAKLGSKKVGFTLGSYNSSLPLVIDPLVYGSYYGGDGGWDEVRAVVADATGGVYITGATRSPVFPNIYGPYGFQLKGTWDAYVARFQGDAYIHDYCAYVGGSLDEAGDRIQLDPFGDIWIAGRTESSDYPGNTRANIQYIRQEIPTATGGSYVLELDGERTNWIPYNASAAAVQAELEALPNVGAGNVVCTRGPLPTDHIRVEFANSVPWRLIMFDRKVYNQSTGVEQVEGIEPNYVIRPVGPQTLNPQTIRLTGSRPDGGGYTLTFTARLITDTTTVLDFDASAAEIQAALIALDNIEPGEVEVTSIGPLPDFPQTVTFLLGLAGNQNRLVVNDADLVCPPIAAQPDYEVFKYTDIFVQRWKQSADNVLDPLPTRTYIMGAEAADPSDYDEPFGGQLQPFGRFHNPIQMAIVPKDNPDAGDPVEIVVAGTTMNDIPGVSGSVQGLDGFIYRFNFDNDTFTDVSSASFLVQSSFDDELTGLAVDAEGSVYVSGTIYADNVYDTSVISGIFDTTPGVFFGGRLLRGQDAYLRKYDRTGQLVYSALLGGNGSDEASSIAVDKTGAAYVLGIARSFNFPRTRGVFGETFDANPVVYVTKVNTDASEIIYSTNLRTQGGDLPLGIRSVQPKGIAIDSRGQAFITGMIFPRSVSFTNGNPAVVAGSVPSSIVTTADALQTAHVYPAAPQLPTWDGWITVLNQTATGLVYSSYIGGNLDEQVFAPHVDKVGDVWIVGSTDAFRLYAVDVVYTASGSLPTQWISPLAFKSTPDASPFFTGTGPVPHAILETPFKSPAFVFAGYNRDGFLVKLRMNIPTISEVQLNPETIAGGLGASSAGTVILSGPAPAGGLDIVMSVNNTAASFDPNTQVNTLVLSVPQGASTASFTVYSNPVQASTAVEVKASLEGNFQIAQLVVEPWITQLTAAPNSVIGGNTVVGRVRLYQVAINDITVDISSDNSGLLNFPAQVIVPAGLDTVTFNIGTEGVATPTTVPLTASLLGVGRSTNITLLPANLLSVTFDPTRVTGGTPSTGTVSLDGKAGGTFVVDLTMDGGLPPGYSITPSQLTFNQGDRTQSFVVQTAYESTNTQKIIRATRPAQPPWSLQQITGTLFVDNSNLINFTINPTTVDIGENSIGSVTLSTPAGAGGAVVNLASSNPTIASVPAQVIVPSGATSVNFTIDVIDTALSSDATATITASRGPTSIDRVLTVRKTTLDLVIVPNSVVGGQSATGTITIGAQAPSGGLVVDLASDRVEAQVQAQVTVPAGATSVSFPITTTTVGSVVNATITASSGSLLDTAILQIKPIGLLSIKFNPSTVRGGLTTQCRIDIDAPAPGGGAQVALSAGANSQIVILPPNVTIPAGQTFLVFTVQTRRVSRTLTTVVTASYNGSQASGSLTVRK